MTWRATRPLKRDIFEIAQAVVGNHTSRIQGTFVSDSNAAAWRAPIPRDASLVE